MRRLGVVLAGLFITALALAGPAAAHATLVDSSPNDGARLQHPPATVTVTFDESVGLGSLGYLHVTDSAGRSVDAAPAYHPSGKGNVVADKLRSGLGDGTYLASYRVISADSHPVAGVVRFVVGNGVLSTTPGTAATSADEGVQAAMDVARWISFAGFALLGGAWLLLTVWPQGRDDGRARRLVWSGWAAALAGAILELVLEGPLAAGTAALGSGTLLDATLHTGYGTFHSVRLLLLGGIALLFGATLQARERTGYEAAYWPLMVGVALTFSATGHAATTAPNGVSVMLDVLHLCAMSAWLGGLVLVLAAALPRAEPAELAAAIPVFSRVAFWSVVTLAVSGAWAAWHGVGLIAGFTTEYGLLVLGKILLFLGLVVLGNVSRTAVQRRWGRVAYAMTDAAVDEPPAPPPLERLRRSVIVEVAVAAVVLAVTAVLVGQPRGKETVAVRNRQPVTASTLLGGGQTATVTISPGVHGNVAAQVTITGGTAPQSVTGSASLPARHLGPIPLALHRDGADLYSTNSLTLPAAGSWQIALTVTRSEFDAVTAEVALTLH